MYIAFDLIMEANGRVSRRSRPRPYDLRRKVLLKNFLREQMTYIPQTRLTSPDQNSDADFVEKSIDSLETNDDVKELNDENSLVSNFPVSTQTDSTSETEIENNDFETHSTEDCSSLSTEAGPSIKINPVGVSKTKSKISKFTSLMNLRSKSKKRAIKGIVKAKKVCKNVKSPVKSKSLKNNIERILSDQTSSEKSFQSSKSSFKSFFTLLRSRKIRRKRPNANRVSSVSTKKCESAESDHVENSNEMSYAKCKEELNKAKELTKLLQEENRLLTQSLSYFLSSPSVDSSCTVPLQDSNQNISMKRLCDHDGHNSSTLDDHKWNHPSRILRSKSVHENSDHKPMKGTHRTRSMNCHIRNNLTCSPASVLEYSSESQKINFSQRRRNNLPVNRSNRVVQRRFSMPERFVSENDSLRTSNGLTFFRNRHRTRSMSCHDNQSNFFMVNSVFSEQSAEKSILEDKQKNILVSLPVEITGRRVQRRSSMPERTLSVEKSVRRKSGGARESYSRTPFHSLPPSAFY